MVAPSKTLTRTKFCPDCEGPRPISSFGRNRQSKDGLHYYCKECAAARQRKWARANPETVRAMRAGYLKRVHEANAGRDPYE
jgi:formate dehydrogenase maturation protein FdhE